MHRLMLGTELKTFLPTNGQFAALKCLSGAVTVYRRPDLLGGVSEKADEPVPSLPGELVGNNPRDSVGPSSKNGMPDGVGELILKAGKAPLLRLTATYRDVRFKFEIFMIVAELLTDPLPNNAVQIATVKEWQTIKCCFRFEWERPTSSGEVPTHYEPIIRDAGRRDQIPDNAIAAGVSMVGIVFWDERRNAPVSAFVTADWPPASLSALQTRTEIEAFLSKCEIVDLADASSWCAKV